MKALRRVPGKYAGWLHAAIAQAIDDVYQDVWRRENGLAPSIPDTFLIEQRDQDVFVVIGGATESVAGAVTTAARARGKRSA